MGEVPLQLTGDLDEDLANYRSEQIKCLDIHINCMGRKTYFVLISTGTLYVHCVLLVETCTLFGGATASTLSFLKYFSFYLLLIFLFKGLTINVPVVYMVRYKVVLRGDYP